MGGNPDRELLKAVSLAAGKELELLSGRSFQMRTATETFEPNGLPFVEVPDAHVGSVRGANVWEIPDPVEPSHSNVMQVLPCDPPARKAVAVAEALGLGGQLVGAASAAGHLSADRVIQWFGRYSSREQINAILRRLMDPSLRFFIPILGVAIDGWWFQISRRLLWITNETQDEGRLVELILSDKGPEGSRLPLAATEPVLVVARMTQHPVDWAFAVRVWLGGPQRPTDRRWGIFADAVHGHGLPTITVDQKSTAQEIACQVVLKAYWHGYLNGDELAITSALTSAYPRSVERIRSRVGTPTSSAAAALLLEQLIRPGFDPAQGAEATRRYVRRKTSILLMEHRKQESPDRYPWTQVGISERRFYKLLPQFAEKVNGRYSYDHDDVVVQMRAYLAARDSEKAIRAAAIELLRSRGFGNEAARKWLQRHRPEEALHAWPRAYRKSGSDKRDAHCRVRVSR